jgi:glycerol-3-phosphate dehydrogenase
MNADAIVVIGGGIAGLMTTYLLARAGFRAILLEARQCLASGSSTRNHGWLQSGRFYLLTAPAQTLDDCARGAHEIMTIAPECVEWRREAYLVTADPSRADQYRRQCSALGVLSDEVSLKTLREREPALSSASAIRAAFSTPDIPFSPSVALAIIASAAAEAGAGIRCDTPVDCFRFEGDRISEVVLANGERLRTNFVVNAAGAWSGAVLAAAGIAMPNGFQLFQSSLLVVEPEVCSSMLLSLDLGGPTVVPHRTRSVLGVNGNALPLADPDRLREDPDSARTIVRSLTTFMPSLIDRTSPAASVWHCRKAEIVHPSNPHGRSPTYTVIDHAAQGVSNFVTALPGKFTTAPVMAAAVVSTVAERLRHRGAVFHAAFPTVDTLRKRNA